MRMRPNPEKASTSPLGPLQRSISITVGSVAKRCWSMKRSLMLPLAWPNSMVNIAEGCPRLDARDVTARPWNTSRKSPSPPAGRLLDASTFPPRVVAEIPDVPNSNSGPPQSLCLTPDESLVLVSAPNHIDPSDPKKLMADDYVSVVDLEASPPRVIDKVMV